MARISYVEKEDAPDNVKAVYDQLEGMFGVVPNVIKAMANAPELLMGFVPSLGQAMWMAQQRSLRLLLHQN